MRLATAPLVIALAVVLTLTGCTARGRSATPSGHRSLYDAGVYNDVLKQVLRRGMVVKVKRVQVTPSELQVLDEGGMTFTYSDGAIRGPDSYDNPGDLRAEEPAKFEVADLGKVWQALAGLNPPSMSNAPQRLTIQRSAQWSAVRATTAYAIANLDGTLYNDPTPTDAAGMRALLERLRPVATRPLGIAVSGESTAVLVSPSQEVVLTETGERRDIMVTPGSQPFGQEAFALDSIDPTAWAAAAATARSLTTFAGQRTIMIGSEGGALIYRFFDSNSHSVVCSATAQCNIGHDLKK